MEKNRQRMIEDRKALKDAIWRALGMEDEEEAKRLMKHLEWLEKELKETKE